MINPIEEFARNIAREEVDKHGSASEDLLAQPGRYYSRCDFAP